MEVEYDTTDTENSCFLCKVRKGGRGRLVVLLMLLVVVGFNYFFS